ncbi:sensor histidine kinase [Actinoplanes sp. NPDC051343]|uniref:sensor histidine kinase n=1 Tax=Actinoplanes sp. NPDC051343 TaxID=3363906 RepID=UPI0037B14F18
MRIDAALIALAAVLGALFCLDSQHATVLDLAVGLVACLALLARRRRPAMVAGLLMASTVLSAAGMGATAIAVGAVALYRSLRVTAVVVAVHAAVVIPLFALAAGSARDFVQGTAVLLALDTAAVATGLLARSVHDRSRETEVRHWLQIEEVRHAERERIAREMHDVLAHRISLLAVHAGALEVRRSAPEEERRAAAVVRECAYQALEDLRAVIGMLRDDDISDADRPQPTLADLPALVEEARQAGSTITLDSRLDDLAAAPESVGRHVYRVVQEGLTNARKHAPGAPVHVCLQATDELTVEITNPVPQARKTTLPGAPGALPAAAGSGVPDAGGSLAAGVPDAGGGLTGGVPSAEAALPCAEGDGPGVKSRSPSAVPGVGSGVLRAGGSLPGAGDGLPGAGSGLIGLGERMDLVGGELEFGLTAEGEFRLVARVPWPP